MGTPAALTIYNEEDQPICNLYFHYDDGYIDGAGKEIVDFIKEKQLVASLPIQPNSDLCNGIEDLAAQIVCHFKNQQPIGGVYLYPVNQQMYTDYNYLLKVHERKLELTVIHQNIMIKLFPE